MDREPTLPEAASQVLKPPPRVEHVLAAVAEATGIPAQQICGGDRSMEYRMARQMYAWLCREWTVASFPQIAAGIGRIHHSTTLDWTLSWPKSRLTCTNWQERAEMILATRFTRGGRLLKGR